MEPWVLLICVLCILGSSITANGELLAMESSVTAIGTRTRKVVEQAVIFKLIPNISDVVKENMVQSFTDLKANCPEWVVAESAGLVVQPSHLEDAGVGLFMRFFFEEDLSNFFTSKQRRIISEKYVLPYTTDAITMHFDAKVDDNNETVYRQGDVGVRNCRADLIVTQNTMLPRLQNEILRYVSISSANNEEDFKHAKAFKSGAERIVGIKVKDDTSQEDIDIMIKAMNDLIDVPEFSSLLIQITAVEALHIYSKHPLHIGVISKTVWPIAEKLFQADYIVDGSGARRSVQ